MSFSNCKDTKKYWFPNSICLFMGVFYLNSATLL